jgi:glycosyltransferase involved in cell wall biosynthesis
MEDWGEPPDKLRYLPNPVDLPTTVARRTGGYLLYAGRLAVEKGLESFLRAAARIPELSFKIAGRGPENERLRAWTWAHHAKNIEFLGFQSPEALADIRDRAAAIILPSIWYENASLAILEAMADGLPCLVTRIGGNPELVVDGVSGFLVKPGSEDDWLRVLRRFQALPEDRRESMGEAARRKVKEHFLWSTHIEHLETLYHEAGTT